MAIIGDDAVNDSLFGTGAGDQFNGLGGQDTVYGFDGDDLVMGGGGNDEVHGGLGADRIDGDGRNGTMMNDPITGLPSTIYSSMAGADILYGDEGDDTVMGGEASDSLYGGVGHDTLRGDSGFIETVQIFMAPLPDYNPRQSSSTYATPAYADYLDGGAGNDRLFGDGADDTLIGGSGMDTLNGGAGDDRMMGGRGDDLYLIDSGLDQAVEGAGGGLDTAAVDLAVYTLARNIEVLSYSGDGDFNGSGNNAANTIGGGNGDDTLNGGKGDDEIQGGFEDNTLIGGLGADTVTYYGQCDAVQVDLAAGTVTHATGVDHVSTFETYQLTVGGDSFLGAGEDDRVLGEEGDDVLDGGGGADSLEGGDGDDTLLGGRGEDFLSGGAGNDVFAFGRAWDSPVGEADYIIDLEAGDIIDLSGIDTNGKWDGDGDPLVMVGAATGAGGEVVVTYDGKFTIVEVFINADLVADMEILIAGDHTGHTGWVL